MAGRYAEERGDGNFQPAPAGTHVARCVGIIDLGTQKNEWQGQVKLQPQVIVRWELPFEPIQTEDGPKPHIVQRYYTNSLSEKANLRADLEAWRGKPFTTEELMRFDLMAVLGKPCTVTVVHNDKGKAVVKGVGGLTKGTTCPPAFNPPLAFWLTPPEDFKMEVFEKLPKGFQDQIMKSPEWAEVTGGGKAPGGNAPPKSKSPDDFEDDIPFR